MKRTLPQQYMLLYKTFADIQVTLDEIKKLRRAHQSTLEKINKRLKGAEEHE